MQKTSNIELSLKREEKEYRFIIPSNTLYGEAYDVLMVMARKISEEMRRLSEPAKKEESTNEKSDEAPESI